MKVCAHGRRLEAGEYAAGRKHSTLRSAAAYARTHATESLPPGGCRPAGRAWAAAESGTREGHAFIADARLAAEQKSPGLEVRSTAERALARFFLFERTGQQLLGECYACAADSNVRTRSGQYDSSRRRQPTTKGTRLIVAVQGDLLACPAGRRTFTAKPHPSSPARSTMLPP